DISARRSSSSMLIQRAVVPDVSPPCAAYMEGMVKNHDEVSRYPRRLAPTGINAICRIHSNNFVLRWIDANDALARTGIALHQNPLAVFAFEVEPEHPRSCRPSHFHANLVPVQSD